MTVTSGGEKKDKKEKQEPDTKHDINLPGVHA